MSSVSSMDEHFPVASDQLRDESFVSAIYDELKRMATWYLRKEDSNISVTAHSLVHEAYMKLTCHRNQWLDRRSFFSHAAIVMQRILVDRARAKKTLRRGKDVVKSSIDLEACVAPDKTERFNLLALDEALDSLNEVSNESAEVARLCLFAGLSVEEAGEILGLSRPTAYRYWSFARTWLFKRLNDQAT